MKWEGNKSSVDLEQNEWWNWDDSFFSLVHHHNCANIGKGSLGTIEPTLKDELHTSKTNEESVEWWGFVITRTSWDEILSDILIPSKVEFKSQTWVRKSYRQIDIHLSLWRRVCKFLQSLFHPWTHNLLKHEFEEFYFHFICFEEDKMLAWLFLPVLWLQER